MLKRRLLFICFAAALCLGAAPAFADLYGTVNVEYKGLIIGKSTLELYVNIGASPQIHTEYSVGLHLLDLGTLDTTDPPKDTELPINSYLVEGLVQAFCVDLAQGFPTVIQTYNAVSLDMPPVPGGPMGDIKAKYLAQLLNTKPYATALDAAALQVAIWEVIYETPSSWSVTSGVGNFYLDTSPGNALEIQIRDMVNPWFSVLTQASSYSQYTALSEDGKNLQDFVLVPVPAAVLLGILGLGVVGIKLRKYA